MRIADAFLQCVVYIYPDERSATEGDKAGGSGFLVRPTWAERQGSEDIFVVTNRHVIETMKDPFLRVNLKSGGLVLASIRKRGFLIERRPESTLVGGGDAEEPAYRAQSTRCGGHK